MQANLEQEQSHIDLVDRNNLPEHVAVIMDGNGRWAKEHNRPRVWGHRNGVRSVRAVTEAAAEIGVKYLTLYAFSTENWNRPVLEVTALMSLLVDTLHKEIKTLMDNNIRLQAIGDLSRLPTKTYKALSDGIQKTADNDRMTLILALNYSARWEIREATKSIAREVEAGTLSPDAITEEHLQKHLATADWPDPELLIRTSGEQRISNFLLYQLAYTELYFTEAFWPDFDKEAFYKALISFQNRERRFGKTSDQISS